MKGLAVAVLCVAGLVFCAGQSCPTVDVIYAVHLPHPSDCNMFLRCDHGIAKPEHCPAGLHFSPTLRVCDWPNNAGCTSGSGSTAPPPPPPPPTEETSSETGEGSDSDSSDSSGNSSGSSSSSSESNESKDN